MVGRGVTVGHRAVLHGCVIGDDSLIGMGAVVLSGAVIGKGSLVGAGAVAQPVAVLRRVLPQQRVAVDEPGAAHQ